MSAGEGPRVEDEGLGPISQEFIARINYGFGPFFRSESVPIPEIQNDMRKFAIKRSREDVTSRSRAEIINWVLGNDELSKACICPYCLKIHSRRDNARVHMKNYHKGYAVREFVIGIDASLEEVRRVNESGRFNRVVDKRPRVSPVQMGIPNHSVTYVSDDRSDEPVVKVLNGGETLKNFLLDIENHVRFQNKDVPETNETGDASTSASAVEAPNSPKESREPSPNSSLLGEPNGGTETVDSPIQLIPNPQNPFGCVFCPCSFQFIKDLTIHVGQVHRTRFRCNTCLAEFVQPQHLEHHYAMCHVMDGTSNSQ